MKKKILITLLSFILTASMVGCGNRTDPSMTPDAGPVTVEAAEQTEENDPTVESESNAESEENKESEEESAAAPTPEPTQVPDSTPDAQESSEGAETSKESESEGAVPTTTPAETTTPVSESSDVTAPTEQPAAYTVTEMAATMYVKDAVNLRQGPGTEYSKVGNLAKGQQVTVTGQADNGWYQLDSGAFVSNKYLSDTELVQQVAGATSADADGAGTVITTSTTTNASSGVDFVNYLNQQRSAAGLGTLTWDDGMSAVAQRRAQEISTDLSHNGNVEQYGEIIQLAVTGSASDWYTSWYNSEAHRTSMLAENYTRAGCAVYAIGNNYYVVCNFAGTPISTEQLIEQSKPENLVPAGGNKSGSTTSFSTTGETVDASDPDYGFIYDLFEQDRAE